MMKRQLVLKILWKNADKTISQEAQESLDQYAFHTAYNMFDDGYREGELVCVVSLFNDETHKETNKTYHGYWTMTQTTLWE